MIVLEFHNCKFRVKFKVNTKRLTRVKILFALYCLINFNCTTIGILVGLLICKMCLVFKSYEERARRRPWLVSFHFILSFAYYWIL